MEKVQRLSLLGVGLKQVRSAEHLLYIYKKVKNMEEWKWIPGYENKYVISNYGRVYSYLSNQYKDLTLRDDGYLIVTLQNNKKGKTYLVHRLVLETFIGPPPFPNYECRHYPDTSKINNHINNLQWSTHLENEQDKDYVLSNEEVIAIKNSLIQIKNYKKVSVLHKVHIMTVSQIARGESYANIGPDLTSYNFDSRKLIPIPIIKGIKQRIAEGKSPISIINEFKINRSYFYRIKNGELHSNI